MQSSGLNKGKLVSYRKICWCCLIVPHVWELSWFHWCLPFAPGLMSKSDKEFVQVWVLFPSDKDTNVSILLPLPFLFVLILAVYRCSGLLPQQHDEDVTCTGCYRCSITQFNYRMPVHRWCSAMGTWAALLCFQPQTIIYLITASWEPSKPWVFWWLLCMSEFQLWAGRFLYYTFFTWSINYLACLWMKMRKLGFNNIM